MTVGRVADDPRWDDFDANPSWDDYGVGHLIADDTPDDPGGDIYKVTEKLWPLVHPAAQEDRTRARS